MSNLSAFDVFDLTVVRSWLFWPFASLIRSSIIGDGSLTGLLEGDLLRFRRESLL